MACKMWKITALIWERRLVEKFHISAFPMYYFLYNWIGEHEITRLKKIYLLRIQKKRHKIKNNEMERHKMDYFIFSEMCMRKSHLFCTNSHRNVPYEKQQELNKGSEPWNKCSCYSACAIIYMLYISTYLSIPHGENIKKTVLYI